MAKKVGKRFVLILQYLMMGSALLSWIQNGSVRKITNQVTQI